ncbi:ArsR family transcriptional regulator, partial [Paenibacillus lautus]|nr:ArsR family transcriptional regulator [Paenibacillus lautus]
MSRPAASHHLRILKEAAIISVRKERTIKYYRVAIRRLISYYQVS